MKFLLRILDRWCMQERFLADINGFCTGLAPIHRKLDSRREADEENVLPEEAEDFLQDKIDWRALEASHRVLGYYYSCSCSHAYIYSLIIIIITIYVSIIYYRYIFAD